jgi:hypothetical protein
MLQTNNIDIGFNKMYEESLKSLVSEVKEVKKEKEKEKDKTFELIKENISLTDNEWFFKSESIDNEDKIVKIIDTGVGKSYNTAYLLLYKMFYTTEMILVSTTKNENVRDIKKEIKKIIEININKDLLNLIDMKKEDFFSRLGVCEMTSNNNYKEALKTSRAIITNHSYFYSFGQSTRIRKSSRKIMELFADGGTILIDEFDELEKQAIKCIALNKFYKHAYTLDNKHIWRTTESIFSAHDGEYFNNNQDDCRYKTAINNYNYYFDEKGNFKEPYYRPDMEGNLNLKKLLDDYFIVVNEFDDPDDREGFYIETKDGQLMNVLRTTTTKVLEFDKNKEDIYFNLNDDCDFIGLMRNSHGIFLYEDIIELTDKKRDEEGNILSNKVFKRFRRIDEFVQFLKENIHLSIEQSEEKEDVTNKEKKIRPLKTYDSIISKLIVAHRKLYKQYVVIRQKSILDTINCNKYMYTATPSILSKLEYTLDYDNKKAPHKIKEIDIFFINMKRGEDKKITKISLDNCNNKKINVLSFLAEKRILDALIRKNKDKTEYPGIKAITSNNEDDGVSIKNHQVTFGNTTEYSKRQENVTISYLNGTESTGKNYSDTDLLIMNCNIEIDIKGRAVIGEDIKENESKKEAALRVLVQTCGRIERGDKEHKFNLLIGDDIDLIHKYIHAKKGNGIKYNLKEIKTKDIKKTLDYIEKKINDNSNIEFKDDERVKFNSEEIVNYYLDISGNDEEVDAKKATMSKFKISRRQLNRILKEYKCKQ